LGAIGERVLKRPNNLERRTGNMFICGQGKVGGGNGTMELSIESRSGHSQRGEKRQLEHEKAFGRGGERNWHTAREKALPSA